MPAIVRSVLAVLAGVLAGAVIVTMTDSIVHRVQPLPPGTDPKDMAAVGAAIAAMPVWPLALMVLGWAAAAGAGSWLAARLASRAPLACGLVVTVLLLVATIANLRMIPHPGWMWVAGILLLPLAGWAGARAGSRRAVAP